MNCKDCPVRRECPKKGRKRSCCFGTYMKVCKERKLCKVRPQCEVSTKAGDAVAIWEEYN